MSTGAYILISIEKKEQEKQYSNKWNKPSLKMLNRRWSLKWFRRRFFITRSVV